MASWGCPHESDGVCQRVSQIPCDPGMRGCVLCGRFIFSNPAKNALAKPDARTAPQGNGERPVHRSEGGAGIPEPDF
jgi:hypothetical protein